MLFKAMVVYLSRVGVDDGDGGLPPDLLVGHGRGGRRDGRLPRLPGGRVVGRGRDGAPGAAGLARHVRVVHGAGVGHAVVRGGRVRGWGWWCACGWLRGGLMGAWGY